MKKPEKAPPSWRARVEAYISYRRGLGYGLTRVEMHLNTFARFAEDSGQQRLTLPLCLGWASTAKSQHAKMRRLTWLRGFAQYWRLFDENTEIPPRGLIECRRRRSIPHIFTEDELVTLLDAAERLLPDKTLRSATCRAVFGLLAASGLRPSEAIDLTDSDIDFEAAALFVREGKFRKDRVVPLHPSVIEELRRYRQLRDRSIEHRLVPHFFVFDGNRRSALRILNEVLYTACSNLGWHPRGDYPRHRLYDFRHSFIVRSALAIHKEGAEIDRNILSLSTYVGHANIADTYWYFTAIPELMEIAVQRFQHYVKGGK
ncbi:MAG: tyrosine-type recombinase/integrase [Candidatus Melainabacteria bacterium]|nr:tyrosine-type recombinase/integrase [Candidatus Melainabacteria bacterium]